jgi:hypothetical protein
LGRAIKDMKRFELLVGEPWDFKGPDGPNRVLADLVGIVSSSSASGEETRYILLAVVSPFEYQGEFVQQILAAPRYVGHIVDEIVQQGGIVNVARLRTGAILQPDQPLVMSDALFILSGSLTPQGNGGS